MNCRIPAMALALVATASTHAAEETFNLIFSGDQEVPGPGDPDGSGLGFITINDTTGDISWSFDYFNIVDPTAMHIHTGAQGVGGGVLVGLGVAGSGTGTLAGSTVAPLATASDILADPSGFYVNIHNAEYGGGAIRAQVPEPTSAALLVIAGAGLMVRRRRA